MPLKPANCILIFFVPLHSKTIRLKMSVKKTISLSFLLLANVIMLAHSVVFHHHHDQTSAAVCALSQEHHCDENADYLD